MLDDSIAFPPGGEVALAAGPRVLLAEDDDDIRSWLRCGLMLEGYRVAQARDGLQLMTYVAAITTGELAPPDAIISDVRMPSFSGLEVLREVRRSSVDAPVILITAFADAAVRADALSQGAVALLEKPLNLEDVLAALTRACSHGGAAWRGGRA